MLRRAYPFLSLLMLTPLLGCGASGTPGRDGGTGTGDSAVGDECSPGGPEVICEAGYAIECNADGSEGDRTDCAAAGQVCVQNRGCRTCRPNTFRCDGANVMQCNEDGSTETLTATCDAAAGDACNSLLGSCTNACADAATNESYIGCEYWPTPIGNGVSDEFDFAVVVANPQTTDATVTVTRGGAAVESRVVPPGALETIRLQWVPGLKIPYDDLGTPDAPEIVSRSALVRDGAYRLQSNLPVTVYQFNALEYRIDRDCLQEPAGIPTDDEQCHSFTNDASLLLPTHVLTENYIVLAERAQMTHNTYTLVDTGESQETYTRRPSEIAIVGVSETPTMVQVRLTANVAVSIDGAVQAGRPGETLTFTLEQGDVVQLVTADPPDSCTPDHSTSEEATDFFCTDIFGDPVECTIRFEEEFCRVGDEYDLTGTEITSMGAPVMVMGGHFCAFMPHTRYACDHLEESLFPLETWGDDFIVAATEPLRGEPNIVRIVSGVDGNEITFDPASAHAPVTLNRGEYVQFETMQDFRVQGSAGALLVAQYLVGQNYDQGAPSLEEVGDPSMSLAIPTEQFRTDYTVLAPVTYERNFITIIAPVGASVDIASNGNSPAPVTGFVPVGGSGMQRARIEVSGGTHVLTSGAPFGVVVYGFGAYTSYMYPGGLDFQNINPLI